MPARRQTGNKPAVFWYLTSASVTAMDARGYNDGLFDNSTCTNGTVVLDFGQPDKQPGSAYNGYGTYYFAQGAPFMSDSQVVALAEAYANGWYRSSGTCARLKLVIGVNNYHQCPYGGACTPSDAGYQWGSVVNDVQSWLVSTNRAWQITAWAGSDMEQPGGTEIWDCATKTRQFVDGFNGHDPSLARLLDYGTAWVPNPCWTANDVYYVAYGAVHDYPLPEIYNSNARDSWVAVRQQQGFMNFLGVMTECGGGDPLPTGNCGTEYSPWQAWTEFRRVLNNGGMPASLDYATNIKKQ